MSAFRSGVVALVGRPNVGKSTLLNAFLGEKVAIISPKPQTTRTRLRGIVNLPDAQLVLVDTPGLLLSGPRSTTALHKAMRHLTGEATSAADVGLLLINLHGETPSVSREDRELCERLRAQARHVVVAINKVDKVHPKSRLLPWIAHYAQELAVQDVLPIAAKTGVGLEALRNVLVSKLPEGEAHFPPELHTTEAERFLCEELVREQLLRQTEQEVPHSAAVVIESFEDGRDEADAEGRALCRLEGKIVVERESQKGIVVGKGGARIKEVSQRARKEIEALLGCQVYLRLRVTVEAGWTDDPAALRRLGLDGAS
jgi:GTP-binding protein Era